MFPAGPDGKACDFRSQSYDLFFRIFPLQTFCSWSSKDLYTPVLYLGPTSNSICSYSEWRVFPNFHVVRSALQNSVCLLSVYFCWSGL